MYFICYNIYLCSERVMSSLQGKTFATKYMFELQKSVKKLYPDSIKIISLSIICNGANDLMELRVKIGSTPSDA